MKKRPTVNFYLRKKTANAKSWPLYCRVSYNGESAVFSTRYRLTDDTFNEGLQRATEEEINNYLDFARERIYAIWRELVTAEEPVSAAILLDRFNGSNTQPIKVSELMEKHLRHIGASQHHTAATHEAYKAKYNHFLNYLKTIKMQNAKIAQIAPSHIAGFDAYLLALRLPKTGKPFEKSTINKIHDHLRQFFKMALNEEIIKKTPYANFRKHKKEPNKLPKYLTPEELGAVVAHDLHGNVRLQRVRDAFLFSCYTGLRFSDVRGLEIGHIKMMDGQWWVEKPQKKTGGDVRVPLIAQAVELIERYKGREGARETDRLIPTISNQKTNIYLKEIGTLAGIGKPLNFHCARHTFGTLLLSSGLPEELVSKLMGHSNTDMTRLYAKILPKSLGKMIKPMELIINDLSS